MKCYLPLVVITIFISGCLEIYEPDFLDSALKIPVVEANLSDYPGSCIVRITYASSFGDVSLTPEPLVNAIVEITNAHNVTISLIEEKPGYYVNEEFAGIPGEYYILSFTTPEGQVYKSLPAQIPEIDARETLYAGIGVKKSISKNSFGEVVVKENVGLHLYLDIESVDTAEFYYKIDSRIIQQYEVPTEYPAPPIFCWKSIFVQQLPIVGTAVKMDQSRVVKQIEFNFLTYESPPLPLGWISLASLKIINKEAYEYYHDVNKLLSADQKMFDPIPSQVRSNMYCSTDEKGKILGTFIAYKKYEYKNAFLWFPRDENYIMKTLDNYKQPESDGCSIGEYPEFWIHF